MGEGDVYCCWMGEGEGSNGSVRWEAAGRVDLPGFRGREGGDEKCDCRGLQCCVSFSHDGTRRETYDGCTERMTRKDESIIIVFLQRFQ